VTNYLPTADLSGGKLPTIGDIPVSISNSNYYDEKYYIDQNYSPSGHFFSPGATTPIGGCILQPSSGL